MLLHALPYSTPTPASLPHHAAAVLAHLLQMIYSPACIFNNGKMKCKMPVMAGNKAAGAKTGKAVNSKST